MGRRNLRIWKNSKRYARDYLNVLRDWLTVARDWTEELRLRRKVARNEEIVLPCTVPFTRLDFLERGVVTSCCQAYTKVHSVGNVKSHTIAQIWNGRVLRRIRRRLMLGEYHKVCRPTCPFLLNPRIKGSELPERTEFDRRLKEDVQRGRPALSVDPTYFALSNWGPCNLRCKMCDSWSENLMPAFVQQTYDQMREYFDHPMPGKTITVKMTGAGDPFVRRDTRQMLIDLAERPNPNVRIELLSNGLLLTPQLWEKIKGGRYTFINLSIDAATPETYAKIRVGGRWEILMRTFDVLRKAKAEGHFSRVLINMTVMKSNYREIPEFIRLARDYGFEAYLGAVRGRYDEENIFANNDREALDELARILDDPALYGPDVKMHQLVAHLDEQRRPRPRTPAPRPGAEAPAVAR